MSSEIEYRHLALEFDARAVADLVKKETGDEHFYVHSPTQYLVFVESGSSNTYENPTREHPNGRRARSWTIGAAGSEHQVMSTACKSTYYVNDGMLRLFNMGKMASPETYLRCYRKVLKTAIAERTSRHTVAGQDLRFNARATAFECHPWFKVAQAEGRLVPGNPTYPSGDPEYCKWTFTFTADLFEADRVAADAHAIATLVTDKEAGQRVWVYPEYGLISNIEDFVERGKVRQLFAS